MKPLMKKGEGGLRIATKRVVMEGGGAIFRCKCEDSVTGGGDGDIWMAPKHKSQYYFIGEFPRGNDTAIQPIFFS